MDSNNFQGLLEAYTLVYTNISESHFKVGDEVICKNSGMEGKVVKVDPEEKGKYYTVKREDGKTMKYAPDELKKEMKEAKDSGATKEAESKFHAKLDKMVHSTFGKRKEEMKKEDVDIFDTVLEYLQTEGYVENLEEAEWMMANVIDKDIIETIISEVSYSAKSARAGKDIGKPGKAFEKIAASAAKRYGSKERGEKVAGAVLAKLRAKHG